MRSGETQSKADLSLLPMEVGFCLFHSSDPHSRECFFHQPWLSPSTRWRSRRKGRNRERCCASILQCGIRVNGGFVTKETCLIYKRLGRDTPPPFTFGFRKNGIYLCCCNVEKKGMKYLNSKPMDECNVEYCSTGTKLEVFTWHH